MGVDNCALDMPEKLCLNWSDFQDNTREVLKNLRSDDNFTDVTLACEDGYQVEAHKVILAASSPFFKNLLCRNKHQHPLIYMKGARSENLEALMDFLYCGETSINQENVEDFFVLAQELSINELCGEPPASEHIIEQNQENTSKTTSFTLNETEETSLSEASNDKYVNIVPAKKYTIEPRQEETKTKATLYLENASAKEETKNQHSDSFSDLDGKIKSLIALGKSTYNHTGHIRRNHSCTVCGKEAPYSNIKLHIEAHHMEGVYCNFCGRTFKTRKGFRGHPCCKNN